MNEENIDNVKSSYNEASFKMKRLHELQDKCNELRINPFSRTDRNMFCFHEHCDVLISLYQEVSSKMTKKEKEKVKPLLKSLIIETRELRSHLKVPVYAPIDISWLATKEGKELRTKVNEGLFDCEELLREALDKHGFSTMNQDNLEGDPYS